MWDLLHKTVFVDKIALVFGQNKCILLVDVWLKTLNINVVLALKLIKCVFMCLNLFDQNKIG